MSEQFKEGGFDPSKEKIESPEELRFEKLVEDARHRSLEGNYAFAETEEDERAIHQKSMRGAYLESGDPEKMAMFKLQEAKINLSVLVMLLENTLTNLDEGQQKKGWESRRDQRVAKLEPVLSELGLAMPQTVEEARILKSQIVSSENLQKLAIKYKAEI